MDNNLIICFCKYFKAEAEKYKDIQKNDDVSFMFFPSECGRIPLKLDSFLNEKTINNNYIELIGCNCLKNINTDDFSNININYISQCFNCIAPSYMVDHLIKEGNYLLTPGWLKDWKKHINLWKFDKKTAREFFSESVKSLVLLDDCIYEDSNEILKQFADFVDLPSNIIPIGFDYYKLFVTQIVHKHQIKIQKKKESKLQKQNADLSMIVDLLNNIAQIMDEEMVIQNMLDLFIMLFAPELCVFAQLKNNEIDRIITPFFLNIEDQIIIVDNKFSGKYKWSESNKEFLIRVSMGEIELGILKLDNIAFPEYINQYILLLPVISEVCGLSINNARSYQLIINQKKQLEKTLIELKETQKKLIESEKMASLGDLVTGISHEINTPTGICITAVSNIFEKTKQFSDVYKNNRMTRGDLENYLQSTYDLTKLIISNLNRTAELIKSFKRISVDQISEDKRLLSIKSIIDDIIFVHKSKWEHLQIDFNINCPDNIQITSYGGAFNQIFVNLIINSIKHGFKNKKSGQIDITSQNTSDFIIINYHDNGNGIDDSIIDKIYDPFFSINKSEGVGLGLHIVYNLVNQKLKGSISCESKTGHGTLFKIFLPFKT